MCTTGDGCDTSADGVVLPPFHRTLRRLRYALRRTRRACAFSAQSACGRVTRHGILPASAIRVRPMERTDDEEVATDRRPDYGHLAGPSDRREVRYAVRQGLDEIRASGSRLVVRDRVPLFARGIPEVDHSVGHHFPQQSVQRSSGQLRVAAFDCGWTAQDCVRMVAASGSSMFSTS